MEGEFHVPRVYILCGLSFSGKTMLAQALVRRFDLLHVSIDEINGSRGVGLDNAWISPEDWDITYTESYRQLDECLRSGRSVIYDAGNFQRSEREKTRAFAAQRGADTLLIYVTTPAAVVRQRWLRNRSTHERHDVREDNFELGLALFEPPTPDEHALLYDGEQDANIWVETCLGES